MSKNGIFALLDFVAFPVYDWVAIFSAFPPRFIIICETNIGEDCIRLNSLVCIFIIIFISPRNHTKITCFWINGPYLTTIIHMKPSNIVTNRSNFPSFVFIRWNQHGKICFSACRWKCRSYIKNFTLWIFNFNNQHMFS